MMAHPFGAPVKDFVESRTRKMYHTYYPVTMKKLNLGCGCDYREGWINHDHPEARRAIPVERTCDLNKFPWSCFEDNEFDLIEANHILEHLDSIVPVMKELTRILKPNGTLVIRVPHFSRTWVHAMHKTCFARCWYEGLVGEGYLEPGALKLMKTTWTWSLNRIYSSKGGKAMASFGNALLNPLANFHPMFCERIWAGWFGGFDEMEFVFVKRGDLKCVKNVRKHGKPT